MTLHLIRLPIRISALARWGADRGWAQGKSGAFDEGRALHHLLSETFGKGMTQPFRLLVPPRANAGNLYAYSNASANSPSRITLENNGKIRSQPDGEKAFARASGGQ